MMKSQKGIKAKCIICQNVLSRIITSPSKEKNFYEQPISSDIKRYEEIRKLMTGEGEDLLQDVCWIMITLSIITD